MSHSSFDLRAFLKTLTQRPGIYRMLNAEGEIIYIGKAKNLKKRVTSYFRAGQASPKQQALVSHIAAIDVTVTHTEGEALMLESQQIKQHQPRYNVCLRDDKSYPYIYISTQHPFPRVTFHRGAKTMLGQYYGPYPNSGAVRQTLKLLQRMFPVRQCEDSYFQSRTRPCLQYQIKRCTAPCVGLVTPERYAEDVRHTQWFLAGKGSALIDDLIAKMDAAAENLAFERAAQYRDQIAMLRTVLEKNFIAGEQGDMDIWGCAVKGGVACVEVFFIRHGQHLGHRQFFPSVTPEETPATVLQAFLPQYYLERPAPPELLVSHALDDVPILIDVLSKKSARAVNIAHAVRGDRHKWLMMAQTNAENALTSKLASQQSYKARLASLQTLLNLPNLPERLECFDISHTQGEQTVASCVVFNAEGPLKSAYRRFNIEGITPGDDYAALQQAITRRYRRIKAGEYPLPDVLFIDGGLGQVNAVLKALTDLRLNNVMIAGVSKGPDRKVGMEQLTVPGFPHPLPYDARVSAWLLIQQIRDEAHRFAITGHRQRRGKASQQSSLEQITGLGPVKRRNLLRHFGGLQGVARASVEALCQVAGIDRQLAQRIYDLYHHHEDL